VKLNAVLISVCVAAALTLVGCHGTAPAASPAKAAAVTPPDDSNVAPTPTAVDIAILRRADALLADATAWNHSGDRKCDPNARSWNLYCALWRASLDVTGAFTHRSAALQEVRWVVDERSKGVELEHRLMGYNNLPTTTFADIKEVLAEATRRLEKKVQALAAGPEGGARHGGVGMRPSRRAPCDSVAARRAREMIAKRDDSFRQRYAGEPTTDQPERALPAEPVTRCQSTRTTGSLPTTHVS
jgi:hypothetical protein